MRKIYLIILISTIVIFNNCTGIYENGKELASAAKNDISQITVDSLKAKIDRQEEFYLIDVRQHNEYVRGNIQGSFNIPRGELEFKISDDKYWEELYFYSPRPKEDEIIIYCKSGARGILATRSLMKLGYTKIKNLKGGIISWNPDLAAKNNTPKESSGCGG